MQVYVIMVACCILLLCLFFKVPVFISVFAGALTYFLLGAASSPAILAQRIIAGTQSIPLLAIPFFIVSTSGSSGMTSSAKNSLCANIINKF